MSPTFRTTLSVLVAFMAVAAPATAQEVTRTVTLDEALALFAANNLELRLARTEAAEAAGVARQASAFPNPSLSGSHETLSDEERDVSESYLNLSQRIEWPGIRSARTRAAERAADAARASLAADSARLAFRVKEAWVRAAQAQRAEAVLEEVTEVFREGASSAEERFAAGDLSLYDRRRIEVERARYEASLTEAMLEAATARRELALLVLPEGDAEELAPAEGLEGLPPNVTPEAARATALDRRWELAAARARVTSAEAGASLARRERIPDLTATGGYKRQSDGLDGLFLGLSIPLSLWDRNAGTVDAAEARLAAADSRASLVRRQVLNDVARALERYRSLASRAELLAPTGSDADVDLLEIARVSYAEGEMELLELLDGARAHLDANLDRTRLRADFWISYYDLERAVGGFNARPNDAEDER